MQRPAPFAPAAPPRPAAPKPAAKPLARSYTPLKLEVQRGAKELVVDDFVDTYFRERPKTIRGPRLDELPLPPPEPTATGAQGEPRAPVDEESGIRALGATRDEIELSIAEHEEDLIALEARLADRDEHIESMQGEMLRLQMELEALRRHRASSRPPHADAGQTSGSESASPRPPWGDAPVSPGSAAATEPAAPASDAVGPARRSPTRLLVVAAAVLAAAGLAGSIALRSRGEPAPAAPSAAAPAAPTVAPSTVAPTAESAAAPTPAPVAQPQPSSPVSSAAPVAPTQAPAAVGGALPPASDVEEAGLLSFQAHLTVRSDIDAEVVVQGQPVGRTNQKLLVRCGPRNVRIRDERGWRSAGEHVRITCMHAVTVPIPASP